MSSNEGTFSCAIWCCLVGVAGGILTVALLLMLGEDWLFIQAVFMGLLVAGVGGALLLWLLCRPLPAPGEAQATAAKPEATPAAKSAPAPAAAAPASAPVAEIKPSTPLPGEAELAERKGSWKYEAEPSAPAAKPAPAAAAPVVAAEGPGTKPETLEAARDGGPDDLKSIKGVGPKLEALLHSMGFYHFDQVAAWGPEEVAWVDQNLQGFKGRVSRDNWVEQAQILASGGSTEFSKKVDKGAVY